MSAIVKKTSISRLIFINPTVGLVLDQTGSCASPRDPGCHLAPDPFHSAREESSHVTAGLLSKSRGRVHVPVYGVRVHGADGVLPGEHRPGDRRVERSPKTSGGTTAGASTRAKSHAREDGQDLRHHQQGRKC